MIEIRVNGQTRRVDAACTVADLVAMLEQPPAALATAVNGDFVARAQRASRVLRDGDDVTTFQPITGG